MNTYQPSHLSPLTWNTARETDLEEAARTAAESVIAPIYPGQAAMPAPYTLTPRGRHAAYDRFVPTVPVAQAPAPRRSLWARVRESLVSTTHTEPDAWDMLAGSPLAR